MIKKNYSIKNRIKEHLEWDNRIEASKIKIDIKNGNVKLGGSVPNYSAKRIVEETLSDLEGIKSIENNVEVVFPKSQDITEDMEIKSHIQDLLYWNRSIDASGIKVKVDLGVITLEGTVEAYWKKNLIEEIIEDVEGVIEINNNLAIVPTEKPNDNLIAEDVTSALQRNKKIDANKIDFKVEEGKVILEGTVPNRVIFRSILDTVQNTKGVRSIENNLIIR